jgi:hypothetical protein
MIEKRKTAKKKQLIFKKTESKTNGSQLGIWELTLIHNQWLLVQKITQ